MGGGGSALRVCADHRGGINWLSLSPDGQRLLTGSEDGTARLWSTADGQCCALLQGHESYVTFCHLEDEAAFTCSADHTIRRWDVLTGQCLQVYRGHTSIVNRILVANNQLFSSSYDRTARVWSVDEGQMCREFRGHRNCVLTVAYSAPWDLPGAPCMEEAVAGGLLVTGSTDGTAKVWQVASGCCHQTLRGHTGAVLCLVLDTPGHTAFTGSTDATIRAWDILSGEQLRVFREHQGSVICLEGGVWGLQSWPSCRPSLLLLAAGEPTGVLWQRRQDCQVLAGRHGGACAHIHGPQTQRELHAGRRPLTPRLAGDAAPAPAGARPGALHRLARRRPAPLGCARTPGRPAAHAQPLAPLQQQGGLRRRAPAAGLSPRGPCGRPLRCPPDPRAPSPVPRGGGAGVRWSARSRRLVFPGWPGGPGSGRVRPGGRPRFPFRVAPALPPYP
uniref:WD repeat domain 86 n=1 Tax=Cebus imitator TaxID=2715852 RepID=A0A2K5RPU5_CEBIM